MNKHPLKRVARPKRPPARLRRWAVRSLMGLMVAGVFFFVLSERGYGAWGLLTGASDALFKSVGLSLESMLVEGRQNLGREELQKAVGLTVGCPMTSVDVDSIQRRLQALPWVKSVSVERRLPDQVIVRLQERKPLARWQHEGQVDILASDGVAIPGVQAPGGYASLPLVVGKGANRAGEKLLRLVSQHPLVQEKVASAVRVSDLRWDLHLKGGLIVRLPAENAEKALRKFEELMEQDQMMDKNISVIDFRLPGRFIVQYKDKTKNSNGKV